MARGFQDPPNWSKKKTITWAALYCGISNYTLSAWGTEGLIHTFPWNPPSVFAADKTPLTLINVILPTAPPVSFPGEAPRGDVRCLK